MVGPSTSNGACASLQGKDQREEIRKESSESKEEESKNNEGDRITREEINNTIRRLKKKKSPGEDEIRNEAWINADVETREKLREII